MMNCNNGITVCEYCQGIAPTLILVFIKHSIMLKQKIKSIIFLLVVSAAISCSKDNESGPDSGTGGTGAKTPYIEYKIGTNAAVRVDCSEISFEARPNETVSGVIATSASTKASFSFAFP